jgi:hypothetical protein
MLPTLVPSPAQVKFQNMKDWFLAEPRWQQPPAIDLTRFKKLWKEEKHLKERKASSHSKCSVCYNIDVAFNKLQGNNTAEAEQKRKLLATARAEQEFGVVNN